MKQVNRLKIDGFTAVFKKSKDGGYFVQFPELGDIATQGETLAEAKRMAKDAIEVCRDYDPHSRYALVPKVSGYIKREVLSGILKQSGISLKEFMKA